MMIKQVRKRAVSDVSVRSPNFSSATVLSDVANPPAEVQETDSLGNGTGDRDPVFKPPSSAKTSLRKTDSRTIDSRKIRPASAAGKAQRFAATHSEDDGGNRQAELFYLQKQIQQQTQMVFILEDGARIQGIVEWYDRHSIKVRGKARVLIYKSAIKYLYKAGELGSAPEH